jgi:predicted RNase H-like HicB family nuclease
MPGYSQFVAWSHEDQQYMAVCPELGHLIALADTEEDAVRELKVAIGLVLQDMAASGETPPAPFDHGSHSGQFRIRIPRTLHARLAWHADRERVSLNTLVCSLLSEASAQLNAAGYVAERVRDAYHGPLGDRDSRIAESPPAMGHTRRAPKGRQS